MACGAFGCVFDALAVDLGGAYAALGVDQLVEVGSIRVGAGVGFAAERAGELVVVQGVEVFGRAGAGSGWGFEAGVDGDAVAARVAFEWRFSAGLAGEDDASSAARWGQAAHVCALVADAACGHAGGRPVCVGEHGACSEHQCQADAVHGHVHRGAVGHGLLADGDRRPHRVHGVHAVAVHADPLPWVRRVFGVCRVHVEAFHDLRGRCDRVGGGVVLRRVQCPEKLGHHVGEGGVEVWLRVLMPQSEHRHRQTVAAVAQQAVLRRRLRGQRLPRHRPRHSPRPSCIGHRIR